MTGPTHRQYSICFSYIALMLSYSLGISKINYYLALPIVLLTAKSGALFPDVDHDWVNVSDKTTLNKIINALIHATGGKHRSWQTHSIDIVALYTITAWYLPRRLFELGKISEVNKEVMLLVFMGFASGWISHLFSDMLTSAGVRLVCWSKFKLKLVPRKLGPVVFNTGHEWEAFNYKVIKMINLLLGILCLIYPLIVNGTINKLISN